MEDYVVAKAETEASMPLVVIVFSPRAMTCGRDARTLLVCSRATQAARASRLALSKSLLRNLAVDRSCTKINTRSSVQRFNHTCERRAGKPR